MDPGVVGFDQADAEIRTLDAIPLGLQDLGHAVPECVGHDQDARGQGQAGDGKERLHGPAFEIPHRDAESVGEQVGDAGALDEGGPVIGRGLRAHGLGGRHPRRPANRAEHPDHGGDGANQQRQGKSGGVGVEGQVGEPEEFVIQDYQPMT